MCEGGDQRGRGCSSCKCLGLRHRPVPILGPAFVKARKVQLLSNEQYHMLYVLQEHSHVLRHVLLQLLQRYSIRLLIEIRFHNYFFLHFEKGFLVTNSITKLRFNSSTSSILPCQFCCMEYTIKTSPPPLRWRIHRPTSSA